MMPEHPNICKLTRAMNRGEVERNIRMKQHSPTDNNSRTAIILGPDFRPDRNTNSDEDREKHSKAEVQRGAAPDGSEAAGGGPERRPSFRDGLFKSFLRALPPIARAAHTDQVPEMFFGNHASRAVTTLACKRYPVRYGNPARAGKLASTYPATGIQDGKYWLRRRRAAASLTLPNGVLASTSHIHNLGCFCRYTGQKLLAE